MGSSRSVSVSFVAGICLVDCCPEDQIVFLPSSSSYNCITVTWIEPIAIDYSGQYVEPIQTHYPCDTFPVGVTLVKYEFATDSGVNVSCQFDVEVKKEGIYYIIFKSFHLKCVFR